ncbi:hypothetical protein D3C81_1872400 [compost metagenome]
MMLKASSTMLNDRRLPTRLNLCSRSFSSGTPTSTFSLPLLISADSWRAWEGSSTRLSARSATPPSSLRCTRLLLKRCFTSCLPKGSAICTILKEGSRFATIPSSVSIVLPSIARSGGMTSLCLRAMPNKSFSALPILT